MQICHPSRRDRCGLMTTGFSRSVLRTVEHHWRSALPSIEGPAARVGTHAIMG